MSSIGPEGLEWHDGSCHCGNVRFRVALTRRITITVCNCGICHRAGHQELLVSDDRIELLTDPVYLKEYRFGDRKADHTFCVVCGIMPFYRPRSHPEGYFSVNARCLNLGFAEDIEWVDFDGQNWQQSIDAGLHRRTE